jgi:hypothetical protein
LKGRIRNEFDRAGDVLRRKLTLIPMRVATCMTLFTVL